MGNKSIDFNDLLKGANLLVAGLLIFTFSQMHGNEYVNQETIVLAILLCIQTHIALLVERRRRDPFVILLAFDIILFFSFRIVTLTFYPFSAVFDRYQYDAGNSNYALIFIIVANTVLYSGLYVAGRCKMLKIDSTDWRASAPLRVVFLMVVAICFAYFSGSYWNEDNIPRALGFLAIFLTPSITLLMALAYFLLFRKSLSKKFAVVLATLIVADAAIHTLTGSRSAIIFVFQNVMIVSLAIMGCVQVRRKHVFLGIILLPVVVALLIAAFAISTYNRSAKDAGRPLDLGRALKLAGDSSAELSGTDVDLLLTPIASRAGYFDLSAEIIAHRAEYSDVFSLSTYAKSIIDNVLTPGFDVFDQPKIANALRFIYEGLGTPSKQLIVADTYQSDQLGIYGEFYGLFGYACLPLFFAVAFTFKRIYVSLMSRRPFVLAMKRAVVLSAFVWTIDSFGVDWTILEVLPLVVAMFIYAPFFSSKPVRALNIERTAGHLPADRSNRLAGV